MFQYRFFFLHPPIPRPACLSIPIVVINPSPSPLFADGFRANISLCWFGFDAFLQKFWFQFMTAGLSYYLYNEVAFLALNSVHPITRELSTLVYSRVC